MEKLSSTGSAKLEALLDAGSFVEIGAYVKKGQDCGALAGVITGYGAIDGRLVYVFAQDFDRVKGAMDALQASKIENLYQMALTGGAPVIGVFDSAGATVADGAASLAAYGRIMKAVTKASGVIPQIALVPGVCAGMAATIASMFDFTVMVKDKTKFYVTSPFALGDSFGSADAAAAKGLAALVAENETDAGEKVRELFRYLPSNNADGTETIQSGDDINRQLGDASLASYELIKTIADDGKFIEIHGAYGKDLIVGFASVGYDVVGVVASNSEADGGALTPDGARKAAKFVSFCDSFDIPLLTLVDSVGIRGDAQTENDPMASALGRLAQAYAASDNAKVTVVTGKAYGAAFTLLGSKALGADLAVALDEAQISILPPETAVAFLWNDQIKQKSDRAALEEKWLAEKAGAMEAAGCGAIDDVVTLTELRQRICAGFYMLSRKSALVPERRHMNLPL